MKKLIEAITLKNYNFHEKLFIVLPLTFIVLYVILVTCAIASRSYTLDEVVSSVICAEACSEGEVGMYAVANTIANRSRKRNMTPYQIVRQKNQYFGYTASNREELYNQCGEVSDKLTSKIMQLDDITDGATYFRKVGEKKRSWHMVFTVKIGKHLFYK